MVITCWSVKGGVGVTAVAAAIALAHAAEGSLLVDLVGDMPALFGQASSDHRGLGEWLGAGTDVPRDALARLEVELGSGVAALLRGSGPLVPERIDALRASLAADRRMVVVDAGCIGQDQNRARFVTGAEASILVARACPLSRRALAELPQQPTGVVVVRPQRRAVGWREVEEWCQAPVLAQVDHDPAIGWAVAAGLDRRPLPRSFLAAVRGLA